jgi:hypothetical protein
MLVMIHLDDECACVGIVSNQQEFDEVPAGTSCEAVTMDYDRRALFLAGFELSRQVPP